MQWCSEDKAERSSKITYQEHITGRAYCVHTTLVPGTSNTVCFGAWVPGTVPGSGPTVTDCMETAVGRETYLGPSSIAPNSLGPYRVGHHGTDECCIFHVRA